MNLFELVAKIGMDTSEFEQGVGKSRGLMNKLGSTVSAGTVAMGNLMADGIKRGVSAIMDLGRTGIEYNAQMEDYTTRLTTVMGDANAAAEKMAFLTEYANKTPFELPGLAAATTRLLQFGTSVEDVDGVLKMLGDVSLGDSNAFERLTYTFSQVQNVGKMTKEDFNQLAEAGFNPLMEIANATGAEMEDLMAVMSGGKASREFNKLTKNAQKEVKKMGDEASESAKLLAQIGTEGMISADMLQKAFELATSEGGKFYNGMDNAAHTLSGLFSTVRGSFSDLRGKVFKPVTDYLTETMLPNMIGLIDRLHKAFDAGGLAGLLGESGSILSTLASNLIENAPAKFGAAGQSIANEIIGAVNTAFGTEIPEFTTLDDAIEKSLTNANSFVTDVLQWISDNGETVSTALTLIAIGFTAIKIAADPIGSTIGLVILGFGAIVTNWEKVKSTVNTGLETLQTDFNTAMTQLDTDYGMAWNSMKDWFHYTFGLDLPDWETLKEDISSGWETVSSAISGFFTATFEVLTLDDARAEFAVNTAEKIGTWWEGVKTTVGDIFFETFGIELPSIEEVAQGIKDWWNDVKNSIGELIFGVKAEPSFGGGTSKGTGAGRGFAVGLDYVPTNNYVANLHRGEAVLTRTEADAWRSGKTARGNVTVVQNIYAQEQTAADLMQEAMWQQERAVLYGV